MKIKQILAKNFYTEFHENQTNSWEFLTKFHENPTNSCEEFLHRISWKSDKFLWRIFIQNFTKIRQIRVKNSYTEFHENPTTSCEEFLYKISWKSDNCLWFFHNRHRLSRRLSLQRSCLLVKTHNTQMWSTPSYSWVLMHTEARRCPLEKFNPLIITPRGKSEQEA